MSHSKLTKRGNSLYLKKWNPRAKNFINTCKVCGAKGYRPSIEDDGFTTKSTASAKIEEHAAIASELMWLYKPLALDHLGRCEDCARLMDNKQ